MMLLWNAANPNLPVVVNTMKALTMKVFSFLMKNLVTIDSEIQNQQSVTANFPETAWADTRGFRELTHSLQNRFHWQL